MPLGRQMSGTSDSGRFHLSYPSSPPFAASEFDRRSRQSLAAIYYWAESDSRACRWLQSEGVSISESGFSGWRRRHGLAIANPDYAQRGHALREEPDVVLPSPSGADVDPADLKRFLRGTKIPRTVEEIADHFDVAPRSVRAALDALESTATLIGRKG